MSREKMRIALWEIAVLPGLYVFSVWAKSIAPAHTRPLQTVDPAAIAVATQTAVSAQPSRIESSTVAAAVPAQIQGFLKLSIDETRRLFDEGKAVFVDGRSPMAYQVRHVKGSLNCSIGDFERQSAELKQKVALDTMLVMYCGGETCGLAERIAGMLAQQGFTNIAVFAGGWPAWSLAKYPMEP